MALVDLTRFDPWSASLRANEAALAQRNAALQGVFDNITRGIQAGQARRAALEERNMAIRDREYALANQATDKLVQARSNHKYTDVQLQQVGQQFKQEFYDAVKEYEASDKGDEARQRFEEIKQKSLGSARTIGASIENLGNSMESFMQQAKNGGISDAMDPAVRDFFSDLNDPETPADKFQIVTDPETGQLKYQGETSNGYPVDFFLDDIANGENQFAPLAKVDMPKMMQGLMKNVSDITKQEKYDWGSAEVTDWDTIGQVLDGRIEELFSDPANFKSIAAGLGYGYEELEQARLGEPFEDEDGREITDEQSLRDAMKQELLQQMETVIPNKNNAIQRQQQQSAAEEKIAEQKSIAAKESQALLNTQDYNQYIGKKAVVNGVEGIIHSMTNTNGVVQLVGRKGKDRLVEKFDTNTPEGLALLQSRLTGKDYNLIKNSIIELDNTLNEIAL